MREKIRVLFAIGTMGGGGAERQVIEILKKLDRNQFEPLLYLIHYEGELLSEIPADVPVFAFWQRQVNMGIKYPGRIQRTQVRDMAKVIKEQRVQVVYSRCYLMNLLAAASCQRMGIPHLAAVAVDPGPELKLYTRFKHQTFEQRNWNKARRAYLTATKVLANSEGLAQRMVSYFDLPAEQVQTVYNLFDVQRIDALAADTAPNWNSKKFHLVCTARLHAQKGHYYLLMAIHWLRTQRHLKNIEVHLLGQGEELVNLKDLTSKMNLDEQIQFEGFQQNPLPMVKQADLFCLPSLYEGMPNALVEAVLCRTPVIATDCPSGPHEILENGKWGQLVTPTSYTQLATAIENAMQASSSTLDAARESMISRFEYQLGLTKIEELIKEVAQEKVIRSN